MPEHRTVPLVERERELATLDALLAEAVAGSGRLVLVEGPAGVGKTRLLAEARERAAGSMSVLVARAGELEREFPFGVVRQLFEGVLTEPAIREAAMAGAAHAAQAVFEQVGGESGSFAALHGLYWLTLNLADQRPLLLVIDDLQWCDRPSLRFLAYLSRRLEGAPILVAATWRVSRPGTDPVLLAGIADDPTTAVLRPAPLAPAGVRSVVRARLGEDADPDFCAACHESTGGNPLLLGQLLTGLESDAVRPSGENVGLVAAVGGRAVSRSVLPRLARLPDEARAVARAIAVLGECAALPAVAALARVDEPQVAEATAALVRAEIVRSEPPLGFVHPLVRDAVYGELYPLDRELQHARAAEVLRTTGACSDHVAAQLLHAPPRGLGWVAELLHAAGLAARRRGAADSAVSYLQRALAEPPDAERRPELVFDLGVAATLTNAPAAIGYLQEAYETLADVERRARSAHLLARLWCFSATPERGLDTARAAAAELRAAPEDATRSLAAMGHMTEYFVAGRSSRVDSLRALRTGIDDRGAGARMLEAMAAFDWMLAGGPAAPCAELALKALAGGSLAEQDDVFFVVPAIVVLAAADRDEAMTAWEDVRAVAHRRGSLFGALGVDQWTGFTLLCRGDLTGAEALLRQTRSLSREWGVAAGPGSAYTRGILAEILVERADLPGAAEVLDAVPPPQGITDGENHVRRALAALQLARGDTGAALVAADDYARCAGHVRNPAYAGWRGLRALARERAGRRDDALADARAEVEAARQFGAPRALGRALRIEGMLLHDDGLEPLREAVDVLAGSPARLEHAKALTALGGAMRRARQAREARVPLRQAVELATVCGARGLAEQARAELLATGARPRTTVLGGVRSLTPSELRVAALAAGGEPNKAIAQALYVTPKTVELHLSSAYRKLGIRSRRELADALAAG
ncbi:MAG: helix-turn-helix transcriptional regulator [Pseudonocardia sp.]